MRDKLINIMNILDDIDSVVTIIIESVLFISLVEIIIGVILYNLGVR